MKTFFTMLISFILGGVIGGFLTLVFGAVGGGVAGLVTGSCITVETAQEQGMLSNDQTDKLVKDTVVKINAKAGRLGKRGFEWGEADCAKLLADLEKIAK